MNLALPVAAQAHESAGYSHDDGAKTSNPRWMTALRDDVTISRLSTPGTHDTMAHRAGAVMADFPGPGLIERIIALNKGFKK